ncbi:hypothetical protein LEP1GSC058_1946 [Leptospira fainei serovar Hurstbridge str. BUT 6]|uniref:RNA polymerase alpha subunit C-terminal domain-containing protein n=1 Tax=Leptospira fainei serovar Hurstbridge str. BUT 6 TaxID=1193011 RepID=S3V4J3_9LEPT|nr:hypothetical protein [Leptospira fainei]EPG75509.1 hypothetical protein LEP1GSC058_1946 [Leptospira fainei serovar Hurstbridge str. BUT 6]
MKIHFLSSKLAKPAQRALQNVGVKTLEQLAKFREDEILQLHGIGENAVLVIEPTLKENGLSLKDTI